MQFLIGRDEKDKSIVAIFFNYITIHRHNGVKLPITFDDTQARSLMMNDVKEDENKIMLTAALG